MKSRIPYTKPSITELEVRYATDAAANGWGERCYEYINRFEAAFKAHLGTNYAIATSSCTGALHMGLAALGIGPGDEVIMAEQSASRVLNQKIWSATILRKLKCKIFLACFQENDLESKNLSGQLIYFLVKRFGKSCLGAEDSELTDLYKRYQLFGRHTLKPSRRLSLADANKFWN